MTSAGSSGRRPRSWFAEITVYRNAPADSISLLLMITVPLDRMSGTKLDGYEVGHYPDTPLRGLATYQTPKGLIRMTPEDVHRKVSPTSELGQFVCKQDGGFPKFLLVRPKLLQKLERILEHVNAQGIPAPTFHLMSGYRTPHYNHAIGNVKYSRHVYGDAADVFVDFAPADGVMDDVNGDGVVDMEDSRHLANIVEGLSQQSFFARFIGGLGVYRANESHGPFVHVDTRGTRARW
ncbi:MAG: D-Ala-D-Ala carboxypeptidase family metallohydrolase [Candidatus Eisenbacteria bacterium]